MSIQNALERWRGCTADDRVSDESSAMTEYSENTNASVRRIRGAVKALSVSEIQQIIHIAREENVPIYPISTGNNWGYGTAVPVSEDSVILDLSEMNRILSFDEKLGVVTVEPGVTQQILYDYLQSNHYDYFVPLTGAGPKGSILANALERGFGITPVSDHFSAVTAVSAVLADGTIYSCPLDEYGGKRIDSLYRYSVGPYLDGMFSQSNLGVVTSVTIALAKKTDKVSVMLCSLYTDEDFNEVIKILPKVLSKLGSTTGGFKFINAHQMHAMNKDDSGKNIPVSSFPLWTVTLGLYGDKHMVAAAQKILKRELSKRVHHLFFIPADTFQKYFSTLMLLPLPKSLKRLLKNFNTTVDLFLGKPSSIALGIAYSSSGTRPKDIEDANPGKDGCGIVWFAPLIPIDEDIVLPYISLVKKTLDKNNIIPMITFTSVNDRCFDAPIAITFDKSDPHSVENARRCYDELWNVSKKFNLIPYRLPIDEQWRITESGTPFWNTLEKIKIALDPDNIISPKRYSKR